jgi:GDP-mannose pyrophosphatase NudK
MLIEACAGLLDKDNPEDCIRRGTEEETGYRITDVRKIFEAYMSPGSVTEILYFFVARYDKSMKIHDGGGIEHEQENIEVLEIPIQRAMEMIENGEIKDGKTIMLLQYQCYVRFYNAPTSTTLVKNDADQCYASTIILPVFSP